MRTDKYFSVVIADDQTMVAEGLAAVLGQHEDFKVIALVPNGEKLLQLLNNSQPDLILLDLNMPVMDGFTACEQIRKRFPEIIVVALTSYDDDKIRKRAKDAGATGMLLKYMTSMELTDSLRQIMTIGNGQIFFTQESLTKPQVHLTLYECDKFISKYQLSDQECKVMRLVVEGLTSVVIGEKLFISKHTVDTHRRHIVQKLGIKDTSELSDFMLKYMNAIESQPVE